jgi:Tfp pilus assembly protein PilO
MKLKLLIAPLLVLLIIIMAIWVVAPAYKDLRAQKEELAAAKVQLSEIKEKNAQAAKLKQELAGNTEFKEMLSKYLPQEAQEESVIENLNSLALGEGLAVSSILMTDNSSKSVANSAVNNSQKETASAAIAANILSANLTVAGPYEKIKGFLAKLSALKRGNNVDSLKISAKDGDVAKMTVELVSSFAYFAGGSAVVSANSSIFSRGFDSAVMEQLKSKLATEVVPVNIGEKGKGNPFLP